MAAKLSKKELKGPDAFQSTVEVITEYIPKTRPAFMPL